MAFNARVGNVDDHPLNHGLLHEGSTQHMWRLSPAFDITPALTMALDPRPSGRGPALSLATGVDGTSRAGAVRLIAAASHFDIGADVAAYWLRVTAKLVAKSWESMLREAARTIVASAARADQLVADTRAAFAYTEWLAAQS